MTLHGNFGDPKTERDILSAKRFNLFSLIVLVAVIAATFVLYLQLVSKQRELEIKTQQLADTTANLRRIRWELEAAQIKLDQRDQEMQQQLQTLSTSVENRQFESAMVQAGKINSQLARHDSTGLTLVHLYSYEPQGKVLREINNFLLAPEYLLVKNQTLQELPDWMGNRSAVYFYTQQGEKKAKAIAAELTSISGQAFDALPGNSHDAPSLDNHDWIHIHYLGAAMQLRK